MTLLFVILVIVASFILGLVVLVQNPKGGGLAGNIAGFSTQFMGVKQTTDVLEKGTWIFAGVIAVLCILSTLFISDSAATGTRSDKLNTAPVQSAPPPANNPANTTTLPGAQPQTSPDSN